MLSQASVSALAPHFNLRADRFYNAPDTEIDFTEQGGLMWGKDAVGKLTPGSDPMKPGIKVFVDEVAGADVIQKVERRLQHFIDRKIATLFEPLLNIGRDETLTGLARGFGFRMTENLGVIPRGEVADEVKALEQDARGALRKHGVRFGQFTVFMPLLLKPAPTRLRLVLWALANGMDEFPEAPPPGLVTVPATRMPQGYYTMAGYRAAGARAIRIDMLERLADMLRSEDSRSGFEAKADMLSITGMTLEQFADLMTGLGYKAERGERAKVKAVDKIMDDVPGVEPAPETVADVVEQIEAEGIAPIAETPEKVTEIPAEIPEMSETEVAPGTPADPIAPSVEPEVYYTFTWAGRARRNAAPEPRAKATEGREDKPRARGKPQGKERGGKPQGGKPHSGKPRGGSKPEGAKTHSAGPAPKKDRIDPDNPFAAALMGLKSGK